MHLTTKRKRNCHSLSTYYMPVTVLNVSYILFLFIFIAAPCGITNLVRDKPNKTQHILFFEGSNKKHKNAKKL